MRNALFTSILAALLLSGCTGNKPETIRTGVRDVIDFRVLPFALSEVTLLDGPFKHATDLNVNVHGRRKD